MSVMMDNEADVNDVIMLCCDEQIALKCADICNPCRPWYLSHRWGELVCSEFFQQGNWLVSSDECCMRVSRNCVLRFYLLFRRVC